MDESKPKPEGYVFGRPTTYKPEYCQLLIDHMKQGLSFESFGGVVYCSFQTLYEWAKTNEDFSEAKRIGTDLSRLFWEQNGVKGMWGGKAFNDRAWTFNMKNRFRWRDNLDIEHSGNSEKPAFIFAYSKDELDKLKK